MWSVERLKASTASKGLINQPIYQVSCIYNFVVRPLQRTGVRAAAEVAEC